MSYQPEGEVLVHAETPDGRIAIWVTVAADWATEEAWFCADVVLDNNHVVESLTTWDSEKVLRWVRWHMEEAMRRSTKKEVASA